MEDRRKSVQHFGCYHPQILDIQGIYIFRNEMELT